MSTMNFPHQKVTMQWISKPTIKELEGFEANDLIAYAARVSNPSNQMNKETSDKLVKYLVKNAHWSPLEMVHCTMEIVTTRDIARQILRHRSFSFQEFSQRYAEQTSSYVREARLQDTKNRQNSVDVDDEELEIMWRDYQEYVLQVAKNAYEWALSNGIAKEQARVVLPEGMTESKLYMAGSIRSWVHYIQLREKNGTQKEHMDIALKAKAQLLEYIPSLEEIFKLEQETLTTKDTSTNANDITIPGTLNVRKKSSPVTFGSEILRRVQSLFTR